MAVSCNEKGSLTLVGTPIGNLGDFSPRAVEALQNADLIAAEDTRVTLKLLNHFGIKKPLVSYFEHNKRDRGEQLLSQMEAGTNLVLVSDAGMPAISDPGETLCNSCHERGIPVTVVPGPTAVTTAVALSGFPSGRFTFEGFLSTNKKSRADHLNSVKDETRTMVFYEAPHKLRATARDLRDTFGADRPVAVIRELTKLHEEVWRTTLGEAAARYREEEPRGEYVLVVGGAAPKEEAPAFTLDLAVALARDLVNDGNSTSAAAKEAAAQTGFSKGEIYKRLVEDV